MASIGKGGGTSKWLLPFYLRTNHQQGYSLYLSEEGVSFPGYTQKGGARKKQTASKADKYIPFTLPCKKNYKMLCFNYNG